ncbi:MAG: hypothetical protein ACI9LV_000113 [Candidatus Nanohaloarchaea archaeon]|jgi:hypothetical protein
MYFEKVKNNTSHEKVPKDSPSNQITLEDLEKDFYISLTDLADQRIREIVESKDFDLSESEKTSLRLYLRGQKTISVSTLNKLSALEQFDLLKGEISYVKAGKRGNKLRLDGFPIELNSSDWGFVIGMLPDASNDKYRIALQSHDLIEELKLALKDIGLDVEIKKSDRGYEIYGSRVLIRIIRKAGFIGSKRQVQENVTFPKWVYTNVGEEFQKALVAGIIESEGCAPTSSSRSCRITQSKSLDNIKDREVDYSFETPTENSVSILVEEEDVGKDIEPPGLLLSVKRLLEIYNIGSSIKFDSLYETERGKAARFNLVVTGEDIRDLYGFCSDYLISKSSQFEKYFDQKQEKHRDKGTRFDSYLDDIRFLYQEHGYVTSKMLAEYADRETKTARNTLAILNNKGLIEFKGLKNRFKCWKPVED